MREKDILRVGEALAAQINELHWYEDAPSPMVIGKIGTWYLHRVLDVVAFRHPGVTGLTYKDRRFHVRGVA